MGERYIGFIPILTFPFPLASASAYEAAATSPETVATTRVPYLSAIPVREDSDDPIQRHQIWVATTNCVMAARTLSGVLAALGAPPAPPTGKQAPPPPPLYSAGLKNMSTSVVVKERSFSASPPASPSSSTSISSAMTVVVSNGDDDLFFSPTTEKPDGDATSFNHHTHESSISSSTTTDETMSEETVNSMSARKQSPIRRDERDIYDCLIPTIAVGSIAMLFLGPLLFPKTYAIFLVSYFILFFTLSTSHLIKFTKTVSRVYANLSTRKPADLEAAGLNTGLVSPNQEFAYCHVFLIPNYNEPLSLLQKTVGRLAAHKHAKTNYAIVLAMEESEAGNHSKSEALLKEFVSKFLHILVTVHPVGIPGEARGKGSNVNYAARRACPILVRHGVPMRRQILTVSDSDSAIPELYVTCVERELANAADPLNLVFCPPIFFSRNAFQVPAAVRVTDIMWSVMVMQNLSNMRGITFPCSTYSLSASLADRVGYWDPDFSAIGEDLHMYLKCFFKTNGFVANLHARYVQAKRHYFGLADTAYTIRESFRLAGRLASHKSIFSIQGVIDRCLVCFHVLEAHAIPASSGWLLTLAVPLFQALAAGAFTDDPFYSRVYMMAQILATVAGLPLLICAFVYEGLHRHVDRKLLGKREGEARSSKYLLDYIWLPVSAMLFLTLPSTEASIRRLIPAGEEKYVTAEKSGEDD
ncbi:hypothetical protein SeMB42_g00718 [Synchytrium endobioticum]|uniref:Glycosyltransferase 2-like domain-containing protein n=1 Tax=Synchytrium endobioticum TaxID=286115 RepID=A0A507DPD0_9FUNG|nr:hypothetical protein SeMB42_g00718 [Synchytrium endobioticum]